MQHFTLFNNIPCFCMMKLWLCLQAVICRLLLLSLDDSHRKICTAISMAMASIAVYDWPENWPDLLPFLLKLISDQTNMNGGESLIHSYSTQPDDVFFPSLFFVCVWVLHIIFLYYMAWNFIPFIYIVENFPIKRY